MPSVASGPLTDLTSHTTQMGLPGSNFQAALPLYQPGGNIGSWGMSPPPPTANGSGLAMPMYWQGYYAPPNGLPHLHQQSLLRPPPGLSMPPSMQQPMQYHNFNAPLLAGLANLQSSSLPEVPPPLLPASTGSLSLTSTSLSSSTLPSALPPAPSATLASETLPNKALNPALPPATLGANLPALSPLTTSGPEFNSIVPPIANKPSATPTLPYQSASQAASSIIGVTNSIRMETSTPSLVTPGQILQLGSTVVPSPQPAAIAHKDVEVVQVSSLSSTEPAAPVVSESQPPILPLPVPSHAAQKVLGSFYFTFLSLWVG